MSDEIIEVSVYIYPTIELTIEEGSVDATVEITTMENFEVSL